MKRASSSQLTFSTSRRRTTADGQHVSGPEDTRSSPKSGGAVCDPGSGGVKQVPESENACGLGSEGTEDISRSESATHNDSDSESAEENTESEGAGSSSRLEHSKNVSRNLRSEHSQNASQAEYLRNISRPIYSQNASRAKLSQSVSRNTPRAEYSRNVSQPKHLQSTSRAESSEKVPRLEHLQKTLRAGYSRDNPLQEDSQAKSSQKASRPEDSRNASRPETSQSDLHSQATGLEGSSQVDMSDAECEAVLKQFVEITRTDEACAHFFLQDVNWQLQPALDRFFSYTAEGKQNANSKKTSDLTHTDPQEDFSLTLISWNIDGLDPGNLGTRFTAVCYILSKVAADVVFLQEMIPELVPRIRKNLGGEYNILVATPNEPYFTVVLLKPYIEIISHKAIPFARSGMGRSMQLVECLLSGRVVKLMNTHLESMREHSEIRITQMLECIEQLREWDDGKSVIIYGGDLNIRNHELGDFPPGFQDAWVAAGANPKCQYTWDTSLNDNKSAFSARCRFDRIYFKSNGAFSEVNFSFEGQDRISTSMCFPSDHWAVLVHFH